MDSIQHNDFTCWKKKKKIKKKKSAKAIALRNFE